MTSALFFNAETSAFSVFYGGIFMKKRTKLLSKEKTKLGRNYFSFVFEKSQSLRGTTFVLLMNL